MRRIDLLELLQTEELAIKWAQNNGLLNLDPDCTACGSKTTWYAKRNPTDARKQIAKSIFR